MSALPHAPRPPARISGATHGLSFEDQSRLMQMLREVRETGGLSDEWGTCPNMRVAPEPCHICGAARGQDHGSFCSAVR